MRDIEAPVSQQAIELASPPRILAKAPPDYYQSLKDVIHYTAWLTFSRTPLIAHMLLNSYVYRHVGTTAISASAWNALMHSGLWSLLRSIAAASGNLVKEQEDKNVGTLIVHAWAVGLLIAAPTAGVFLGSKYLAHLTGVDQDIAEAIGQYCAPLALATMMFPIAETDLQFAASIGESQLNFLVSLSYTLIVSFIGYPLVFGWGPFPRLGLSGISWSGCVALFLNSVAIRSYFWCKQNTFGQYQLFSFNGVDLTLFKKISGLSIKIGIQTVAEASIPFLRSALFVRLGPLVAAASAPALQIGNLMSIFHQMYGYGINYLIRVDPTHPSAIKRYHAVGNGVIISLTLIVTTTLLLARKPVCAFFLDPEDPSFQKTLTLSQSILLAAASNYAIDACRLTTMGVLRGVNVVNRTTAISFSTLLASLLAGYWVAMTRQAPQELFFVTALGLTIAAVSLYLLLQCTLSQTSCLSRVSQPLSCRFFRAELNEIDETTALLSQPVTSQVEKII